MNLGLFAVLADLFWFFVKSTCLAWNWFKIVLYTLSYYLKLKPFSYSLFKPTLLLYSFIKWVIIGFSDPVEPLHSPKWLETSMRGKTY